MKVKTCIVLAVAASALCILATGQSAGKRDAAGDARMFATNRCYGKAGLGIIDERLYIRLWSAKNELRYGVKETWHGLDASKPEIAIAFDGKIWSPQTLPDGFDLSKAVVISFEGSRARFFDFRRMSGGYYERTINPSPSDQHK